MPLSIFLGPKQKPVNSLTVSSTSKNLACSLLFITVESFQKKKKKKTDHDLLFQGPFSLTVSKTLSLI